MTEVDEIAAWLRAQAEADIEAAGKATPGPWHSRNLGRHDLGAVIRKTGETPVARVPVGPALGTFEGGHGAADSAHAARHDPLTETARAESVLAVLKLYDVAVTVAEAKAGPAKSAEIMRLVVRDLAAGYRHREGFEAGWLS